jgi:hypothetical protein
VKIFFPSITHRRSRHRCRFSSVFGNLDDLILRTLDNFEFPSYEFRERGYEIWVHCILSLNKSAALLINNLRCKSKITYSDIFEFKILRVPFHSLQYKESIHASDDLHGSVGNIADLKSKGPGYESRISHGFSHAKEVEDIGLTNQPCKRSKICLVIPKEETMTHLVLSVRFAFACFTYPSGQIELKIDNDIVSNRKYCQIYCWSLFFMKF